MGNRPNCQIATKLCLRVSPPPYVHCHCTARPLAVCYLSSLQQLLFFRVCSLSLQGSQLSAVSLRSSSCWGCSARLLWLDARLRVIQRVCQLIAEHTGCGCAEVAAGHANVWVEERELQVLRGDTNTHTYIMFPDSRPCLALGLPAQALKSVCMCCKTASEL